ncbi:probable inactive histone-lysine N-methyltransferase SUVR2 [Sesamum indicum]|uniref:Probable inactive histone-lysine N-methyltransferase SUVR2 n=1 Tax=Sesamum indicum TaxID=4182 RepID=A0A6I9TDP6_SESIN|nr:probable inactive histone-lysine N-methyltransferase SUVR2 [Sesamum indicum]XP_011083059.1 probable inactive histone-lysine N-methyltransferase SUVR2 [Sesamum indicum]XP_011083060.1 probable inactive histone-lysine N-methyltransferase SUVR2 [Sesamum indicum]
MSNKEIKVRAANAFRAMKAIGISEDKVKPVLKNLVKLYDKNWALIEEENYRALADAIFEREEAEAQQRPKKDVNTEAAERPKKIVNGEKEDYLEEEAQATEEPERPLKRLRLRYRDGQSSSVSMPESSVHRTPLVRPKEEPNELPETCPLKLNASQGRAGTPQPSAENRKVNSQAASCPLPGKSTGKQPISSKSLVATDGCEPCWPSSIDLNHQDTQLITETRAPQPIGLRDRGKGSDYPQIPSGEERSVRESSRHAVCLKEPKVEPGIILSPKEKSSGCHALIKPKDEPVTDVFLPLEVPLAVIHPDSSDDGDSSSRNATIREHDSLEPSVLQLMNEKETADSTATPNGLRNNRELAIFSGQHSSDLEIASSPSGEVKISLSCRLALERPEFNMPSLETVLKSVEEKYLRSSKTFDPSFSVINLMKEICQCFRKLGSDSNSESPATISVTSATGVLNESSARDAIAARGLCFSSLNGSVDSQSDAEGTLPKPPAFPSSCNDVDDGSHPEKTDGIDVHGEDIDNRKMCAEEWGDLSLEVIQQPQVTPAMIRSLHDVFDIANGQEKVVIALVNEVNNECPPSFHYIPQNVVFQNAYVNFSLDRIGDKNCCSSCSVDCLALSTSCACAHATGGEFAYTIDGVIKEELLKECISMNHDPMKHCQFFCNKCPLESSKGEDMVEPCKGHLVRKFIKECWWKCGCNKQCGNRVVQRGITRSLQVFMTHEGKGWGLRTLEDLPKGAFVCEYVGEVLTSGELFDRVIRSSKGEKNSFPVLLDADWGAERVLKDEETLCLDATYYGNVARFINHRCYDSNLVEIPVEVETPHHHYYHLAFFTTRKVKAMEELTWDYGIEFDDYDHPLKAFHCQCGSKFCRNIKRSRSRAARR